MSGGRWRERGHEIYASNVVWTLKCNFSNDQNWKNAHTKLEGKLNFYSNFTWIWIWIYGVKISLIMISEFQLWFSLLILDQVQDSPLSVLRCHEACKAWRTCTKCDYMIWQWGVASKCSPPPLKFNWIGLLPIQLNLSPNTHTHQIVHLMHMKLQNYP